MDNKFIEIATSINNKYIKEWKNSGKKIVGFTCSYVPGEIFYSANILPIRLRGIEALSSDIGDTYFGAYICSLPKCILQLAGEGKYKFLDGAIITPGCDSIRRLDECWRKAGEDNQGIVPDFFFHYGVPHKFTPYSLKWFIEETDRLIKSVEKHFNVKITEDKLKDAIKIYNKTRELIQELEKLRTLDESLISGTDMIAVVLQY